VRAHSYTFVAGCVVARQSLLATQRVLSEFVATYDSFICAPSCVGRHDSVPILCACRLQRQYFQEQERSGRLQVQPPPPPPPRTTLRQRYGVPAHLAAVTQDAEAAMSLNFSRQLWGNAVPGV
jgi:hypothetical protein